MIATHEKYFTALEWILFICLCGLSIIFMDDVWAKFIESKSGFAESEQLIKELPEFTLCFTKPELPRTNYEYGKDFKILYDIGYVNYRKQVLLEEGKKSNVSINEVTEVVHFEKLISFWFGNCYKVTSIYESDYTSLMRSIVLYFNQTIDDLPTLVSFITSGKNSYGAVYNDWKNGKLTKVEIEEGLTKIYSLKAEQYNYLSDSSNSKCGNESFYECWGRLLSKKLEGKPNKCSPFSLPNLPLCKTKETYDMEREIVFQNIIKNDLCPKLCKTLGYSGFETWNKEIIYYYPNATFGLGYLLSNMATTHEEYLIYDVVDMIGSVGGSLGMFTGFSFTGVISFLIILLKKGIGKLRSHLENRNVAEVTQFQNQEDKERQDEVMKSRFAAIEAKLEHLLNNSDTSHHQNQPFYI